MKIFIKCLLAVCFVLFNITTCFAEKASIIYSLEFSPYLQINTVTSPVLVANITDKTGNLYTSLYSKFKVISNSREKTSLYLKANALTENGNEEAMFEMGGKVYIAFANLKDKPKSQSLANCKLGTHPKDSPGIVAYPVDSILGAEHKYLRGKNKYEILIENGTSYITVNIGSNVLPNSFSTNDPKGFYQATLVLTESDI